MRQSSAPRSGHIAAGVTTFLTIFTAIWALALTVLAGLAIEAIVSAWWNG